MKHPSKCRARLFVLLASLLLATTAQNVNGQAVSPRPMQLPSTASFWAGEVTVKGACSAFGLDSDPGAASTCAGIPVSLSSGRSSEARRLAENLVGQRPNNGVGHYWLGILELKEENFISAVRHFQTAVDRRPSVPLAHLILGISYAIIRQFELFKMEMLWLTEHASNESLAYFYLGQYYSKDLDQVDKGLEYFQRALQLNPNDIRSRYLLGYGLELKGELEKAKETFEIAVSAAGSQGAAYSEPLHGLARISLQEGDLTKAIEYTQRAIQMEPKAASNHLLLGKLYLKTGDLQKGISSLKTATELDSSDATPYYLLLGIYLKLKMPKEAQWAQARFEEVKKAYGEE
ncbi:MAG: tetratricopeptide repeat protein [Acidobacteria bacterium]|nr:tetratricopeptide repeat protein [Acidobacteriota bacterium]MCI0624612.1 tetratricopeptide repeat protein [Acidobacteriota bacterium]MCI0724605.1 tetratricopeptide repeat protein [Acidobacteriota bacterium]